MLTPAVPTNQTRGPADAPPPLVLQQVRGTSVLVAGLVLMPSGLLMGVLGPTVGTWFDVRGARPLIVPGAALVAAAARARERCALTGMPVAIAPSGPPSGRMHNPSPRATRTMPC